MMSDKGEMVNHPLHYNAKGEHAPDGTSVYEPIKVIESWGLAEGFCLGSSLKYILRARHKGNEREDLEKALWYLNRLMEHRENLAGALGAVRSNFSLDRGGKFLEPLAVAQAWGLSENLSLAIEHIALGNPGSAAWKVAEELAIIKMAQEMAEEVDEAILAQVEAKLAKKE